MDYNLIEEFNIKYIEIKSPILSESNILDIVSICFSNDINLLLFEEDVLSDDFINLKTNLAGMTFQKFINYNIKASLIIKDYKKLNTRFKELIIELNKSSNFRVFNSKLDAKEWLLKSVN